MYYHRGTADQCHWYYPGLSSYTILSGSSISIRKITPVLPILVRTVCEREYSLLDKELEEAAEKTSSVRGNVSGLQAYPYPLETLKEETEEYFQWLKGYGRPTRKS